MYCLIPDQYENHNKTSVKQMLDKGEEVGDNFKVEGTEEEIIAKLKELATPKQEDSKPAE